jgi:tetratricopeptide (TPR) repeat protein
VTQRISSHALQAKEALQANDLLTAQRLALLALEEDPGDLSAHLVLGGVCFRSDRYREAVEHFRNVAEHDSQSFEAALYLAESLRRLNDVAEALKHAERAESMVPDSLDAGYTAALSLVSLARFREALPRLERFCQTRNLPIAQHYLAHCLIRTERAAEAMEVLQKVRRREPGVVKHAILQGQALVALHRYSEAIACGKEILASHPDEPTANSLVAQALSADGRTEEAEPYILAALALRPDAAVPNASYGIWLHQMGRFGEADVYFDKALAIDPYQALPLFLKSESKRFTPVDRPLIDQMEEYVASERTNAYEKIALRFGLGKAYLDLGELERSFSNYDGAHQLASDYHHDGERYDEARLQDLLDHTKALFTREFFKEWEAPEIKSEAPIFVIGMIRSGTTLVEQILSSHPQVVGAGELNFWPDEAMKTIDPTGEFLDRTKLIDAANRYLQLLEPKRKSAERVVDKMPTNWMYVGLIAAGLPHARFVHVRRNPVDIALSIWMTYISDPPPFANRKAWIVDMTRRHADLARHWSEVLPPEQYMQVSYEDLTANPEAVIPKIVAFCGLAWDEACLHPEKNEKFVATPSLFRVRQPIDRKSVSKADKFRDYLGEFAELLGSPG